MNKKNKKLKRINSRTTTRYFRRFFCLFFSSINILIIGIIVIIKHWSIDYYSVNDIIRHIFPAILFLGATGWLAGLILDNPKKSLVIDYKDLIYEELIKTNTKISPEELERKLRIVSKNNNENEGEEEENFAFDDADFNLGESEIEL